MTKDSGRWWVSIAGALLGAAALLAQASPALAVGPVIDGGVPPAPYFESVGAAAIPRDVVAALAQDRLGFLWIATGDGLVRYDGYEFRAQELDSEVAAHRSLGWIRALLPGRDGRLWAGSESQGLASVDPADGRVRLHDTHAQRGAAKASQIQALAEDASGGVWAGYRGEGLTRYDPASQGSIHYRHSEQAGSLPDDRVEALLVGREGTLWVGSWQGLSRRLPGSDRFEPVFSDGAGSLAGRTVRTLFETSDGRIWAGTQQGELAFVDPGTGRGRLLGKGMPARSGGAVTSLTQAPDGNVWVGRVTGIDLHSPQDGRLLRTVRREPGVAGDLAANEMTSLLIDRAGWIWVGGIGVGLQRHNPNNLSISVQGVSAVPGGKPRESDVQSVLQLDNGEIWISTRESGVSVMDQRLQVIGAVPLGAAPSADPPGDAGAAQPASDPVVAMAQAPAGAVWLAADATLYEFDRRHRQQRRVAQGAGATHSLLARSDGTLWVGTQDGLYRLRPGAAALERVSQAGGRPLAGDVYVMAEAADGSLWVGGLQGLFRIEAGAGELRAVAEKDGRGLASPVVIGLLIDHRGVLWVDTAVAGLHRLAEWDGERAGFDRISERHGIVGRPFGVNLLEDGRGRIWTHMHVYDPDTDRIDALTARDGARLGNGRFHVGTRTVDGRLLFGGTKGLMVVRGESFDPASYAPALVVSGLRVNGEKRRTGPNPAALEFAAGERSFGVEFAALDFSDPRRLRYAYRLEGFDRGWIDTGAELRVASYSNLPPGRYALRVRATNRRGDWSPHELAIGVTVQPAWWQTWAFRLAVLALALAAGTAAWRLRTRALRRRSALLESQVLERTLALQSMAQQLQQRSEALEASSLTDPLTGMRNRRFLTQHIEANLAVSVRQHEARRSHGAPLHDDADLVFFLVDLDHFKRVNDAHGHAAGDAVLRQMAERLQQVFRASDHLVRWGGEEFLIVAVGTSRDSAADQAERVRAAVADRPFMLDDGNTIDQTCSIGFACFPPAPTWPRAIDWPEVVSLADAALYRIKAAGRNGWLGIVSAEADSQTSLREAVRGSFDAWLATGRLKIAKNRGAEANETPPAAGGR